MTVIEIENNYSWLNTDNLDIKDLLWKSLRFREKNYFHNFRYKMKIWDGYTNFFNKDSGRFLTGLLPEIKMALKMKGVEYTISDKRKPFQFAVDKIDENFLNFGDRPIKKLHDYQVDFVNQIIKNHRGIVPSPTGSGKGVVLKSLVNALPPKTPTLILANRKTLIDQNYDIVKSLGLSDVGRLYGNKKDPNYITCATSHSAHHLKPVLDKIRVLIVDEVHEMMSKQPKKIYASLKNCNVRIGMSGTAFKFDGKDECQKYEVKGWFGAPFLTKSTESGKLTVKELQSRKILSNADCVFYRIMEPQLPYELYQDAVTKGIAENNFFHEVVCRLVGKLEGRTLIIVERIDHGNRLHAKLPGSYWVQGKDDMETRKYIIDRLQNDDSVVAIATQGIFQTGLDIPRLTNLINAASGQADHQIIQRFGRGLRRGSDKDHLKYYDFIFQINDYLEKHSMKRVKILEKQGHTVQIMDEGILP